MTTFDLLLQLNSVDHSQYINVCRTYFGVYKHAEVQAAIARLNLANSWRLRADILARLNVNEFDVTPAANLQGIYAHFTDASFVIFEYTGGVKKPFTEDGKVRPMTAYEAAELCHYRRNLHPALDLRNTDHYLTIDDDYFKHRADFDPAVLAARRSKLENLFGSTLYNVELSKRGYHLIYTLPALQLSGEAERTRKRVLTELAATGIEDCDVLMGGFCILTERFEGALTELTLPKAAPAPTADRDWDEYTSVPYTAVAIESHQGWTYHARRLYDADSDAAVFDEAIDSYRVSVSKLKTGKYSRTHLANFIKRVDDYYNLRKEGSRNAECYKLYRVLCDKFGLESAEVYDVIRPRTTLEDSELRQVCRVP
jgi:hypothetical protein